MRLMFLCAGGKWAVPGSDSTAHPAQAVPAASKATAMLGTNPGMAGMGSIGGVGDPGWFGYGAGGRGGNGGSAGSRGTDGYVRIIAYFD